MSKFSGKCDLYDTIQMCGGFDSFCEKQLFIYSTNNEKVPLNFQQELDLIPYYAHLIAYQTGKEICLSSKSYIDILTEQHGFTPSVHFYRNNLAEEYLKEYRKIYQKGEE